MESKNSVWVHFSVGFTFRCGVPRLFENCWSQTERLLSTKLNGNIHIWVHVWYMLGIALNVSSRVKVHIVIKCHDTAGSCNHSRVHRPFVLKVVR